MRPGKLLRASTVRLTLLYAGVFAISVLVLLAAVTWSASGFMARQIDGTVANELDEVRADAGDGSDEALHQVIAGLILRSPGFSYLLQDAGGRVIAGNMLAIRPQPGLRVLERSHVASGARATPGEHTAGGLRGRGVMLQSGSYLFVGLSTFDLIEMREGVLRAALWGLAAIVTIALAGGLMTTNWLLRRIDAVTLASREIMAGDLTRRIPVRGTDDEFDRLADSLNAMLDRIGDLMDGLKQVSSDIAHDLRTPLTRLRQRLELARRHPGDVAALQVAIDGAINDSEAILNLFAALLRIAQIEAGTRRSGFHPVRLDTLLTDVAETYRPEIEERGQGLELDLSADVTVRGDRDLLNQLFANLVENALGHCPFGTRISLRLHATSECVCASVTDTGPGIPAALRGRVLQRLFRLEVSRTTPGSGLGLSLVAAIAALHDASLELGNNEPGLICNLRFPSVSEIYE